MLNTFTRAGQLIILVMAAALTIGIIGCGGDGGEAPETASPDGGVTPAVTAESTPLADPTPSPTPTPDVEEDEDDEYAGWLTYTNDVYGYEISYPPEAEIAEATLEDLGEELYRTYTGKACVHVHYDSGFVLFSAAQRPDDHYPLCARTGLPACGDGNPGYSELQETLLIDGTTYRTDGGYEFRGCSMATDEQWFYVLVEDETRIEFGGGESETATFEDYLQIRDVVLKIVQSYRELP